METKIALIVLSKDKQKEVAIDVFKAYPKAQKVSVASDGQAFITDEGDGAARNHARNNRYKKELELTPFTRDDLMIDDKPAARTATEVIALINAATSVNEVNDLSAGDDRKTVIAAVKLKLATFKTSELIALIEAAETVEQVNELAKDNTDDEVLNAVTIKLETLNAPK